MEINKFVVYCLLYDVSAMYITMAFVTIVGPIAGSFKALRMVNELFLLHIEDR